MLLCLLILIHRHMHALSIIPTRHANDRANERGITSDMVRDTVELCAMLHKQGLQFYVMLRKNIPREFDERYAKSLLGIVVMISSDDYIVTVYRSKKAWHKIKRRSKRLL